MLLATAVATTVLVGALVVGDCVRQTLRLRATERLCGCQLAMVTNSPFGGHLRETWRRMKTLMPTAVPPITAAILLKGSVSVSGGGRASAEVIGFEDYQGVIGNSIGPAAGGERMEMPDGAVVNEALARRLGLRVRDQLVIHLAKPGSLAIDASIFGGKEAQVSFRVSVVEILKDGRGDFSLQGGPDIPLNVFLDADGLAKRLWGDDQRRNALLIGSGQQNIDMADAQAAIGEQWSVEDAGLTLRQWGEGPSHNVELASRRVFLDDAVARAAQKHGRRGRVDVVCERASRGPARDAVFLRCGAGTGQNVGDRGGACGGGRYTRAAA